MLLTGRQNTSGRVAFRARTEKLLVAGAFLAPALCWHCPLAWSANAPGKSDRTRVEVVRYSDFGALGDGKTDDGEAIAKAHEYANQHGLPVRADDDATYYIGGADKTAVIQTDTDFGSAKFIIDDTAVQNRGASVFEVRSALPPIKLSGITTLKRDQSKINVSLPRDCVVSVTDSNVKRFIRHPSRWADLRMYCR